MPRKLRKNLAQIAGKKYIMIEILPEYIPSNAELAAAGPATLVMPPPKGSLKNLSVPSFAFLLFTMVAGQL